MLVQGGEGKEVLFELNLKLRTSKKLISYDQGAATEEEKLFQQNDLGKDR